MVRILQIELKLNCISKGGLSCDKDRLIKSDVTCDPCSLSVTAEAEDAYPKVNKQDDTNVFFPEDFMNFSADFQKMHLNYAKNSGLV